MIYKTLKAAQTGAKGRLYFCVLVMGDFAFWVSACVKSIISRVILNVLTFRMIFDTIRIGGEHMPNYQAKGRPASLEPKKRNINIRVTQQEGECIDRLAEVMETTKTKAIVKAVKDKLEQLEA